MSAVLAAAVVWLGSAVVRTPVHGKELTFIPYLYCFVITMTLAARRGQPTYAGKTNSHTLSRRSVTSGHGLRRVRKRRGHEALASRQRAAAPFEGSSMSSACGLPRLLRPQQGLSGWQVLPSRQHYPRRTHSMPVGAQRCCILGAQGRLQKVGDREF